MYIADQALVSELHEVLRGLRIVKDHIQFEKYGEALTILSATGNMLADLINQTSVVSTDE